MQRATTPPASLGDSVTSDAPFLWGLLNGPVQTHSKSPQQMPVTLDPRPDELI